MTALAPPGGAPAPVWQVGGALRAESLYLNRACDAQVAAALRAQRPCLILGPPQSGRSSLRLRLERDLRAAGTACAGVDLRALGGGEGLAAALLADLHRRLELPGAPGGRAPVVLSGATALPLHAELLRYLRDEVLFRLRGPVVVLFDNIDALPVAAREDVCLALRTLFEDRAADPRLARLAVCAFAGAPLPLPGEVVLVRDLSRQELAPLAPLLGGDAAALLDEVHLWTGGHPQATQALVRALAEHGGETTAAAARVAALARRLFLGSGAPHEDSLLAVAAALRGHPDGAALARDYERLLRGVEMDDEGRRALWLLGLATAPGAAAGPRGRLVAERFDAAWARAEAGRAALLLPLRRFEEGGRDPALLLRGSELDRARGFAAGRADLSAAETAFLEESAAQAAAERRGLLLSRVAALALPLALLGALMAVASYQRGQREVERLRGALRSHAMAEQEAQARTALLQARVPGQEWRALRTALFAARPLRARDMVPPTPLGPAPPGASEALLTVLRDLPFATEPAARLTIGAGRMTAVSHGPDAALTTTLDDAGQLHLWQSETGRRLRTLPGAGGPTLGHTFTSDGRQVFAWSTAAAWLVGVAGEDAAPQRIFKPTPGTALVLAALSRDGKLAAGCDARGAVTVWDGQSGAVLYVLPGEDRDLGLSDLRFSPDGGLLALQDGRGLLRLWELGRRERVPWLAKAEPKAGLVAFNGDGTRLLLAGRQSPPRVRGRDGALIYELGKPAAAVTDVALSACGTLALVTLGDNHVGPTIFFEEGQERRVMENVGAAGFSRDGRRIIGWGPKATAAIWEVASGKELGALPREQNRPAHTLQALRGLSQSLEGERLWLRPAAGELATVRSYWPRSMALAYAPGGLVASGDEDGAVRIYGKDGRLVQTVARVKDDGREILVHGRPQRLAEVQGQARALAFSADGGELLVVRWSEARRLRVADGALLATTALDLTGSEPGAPLVIAPGLDRIARGGKSAALWTLADGARVPLRPAGADEGEDDDDDDAGIGALGFSADGRRLALAGPFVPFGPRGPVGGAAESGTGRLWIADLLTTGEPRRRRASAAPSVALRPLGWPTGVVGAPRVLAFAPDGRELFLGAGGCGALIDLERGGATTLCRENERVVGAAFVGMPERPALNVVSSTPGLALALWDGRDGRARLLLPRNATGVFALGPRGDEIALPNVGATPSLFRTSGRRLATLADACRMMELLPRGWVQDLPRGAHHPQDVVAACRAQAGQAAPGAGAAAGSAAR